MKKKYVKIMFLSLSLLTISTTATYAVQPEDDKKENEALQTSTEEHLPLLTINGTNASSSFIVNSEALLGKEITITAPNGFTVTPTVIAANSGKQKVKVTLNSTKRLTEGKIILRSGDIRSYIKVKGFGTALPVKDIAASPVYKKGNDTEFTKAFTPNSKGYTIEFKIKTDDSEKNFYPYFVNEKGYGFKAYITSNEIGLFNAYKKEINNPATNGKAGGKGKFYNNDGQAHVYRFAITPDNRAFIYRDGIPVDSVRIIDYAPQPNFAEKVGKPVENLLKNPNFEGEFDVNPETKLVSRVEGWDVVDVVPNESYTLSALLKGGIAKKEGKLTGKMIIEEVQDPEKKVITEIASDNWETYSMDYTTSAECNQIRVSFTVGRGGWGNDIGAVRVDNAKLTGTSRTYSPKFGFIDNTADVEYFTIDESGAYAPAQPEITINIED